MKLFRYNIPEKRIEMYGSSGAHMMALAQPTRSTAIFIQLKPGGMLGKHEAVQNQLFVVIAGAGEVCGADGVFHPIEAGMAAFWEAGEEHETRSSDGLNAIVIEGENLQPGERLEPVP